MVKLHRTEGNGVFSKRCHLGCENGTLFGNRIFAGGIKDLEMRSSWTTPLGQAAIIGKWDYKDRWPPSLYPDVHKGY
jgi:hypothetical protein